MNRPFDKGFLWTQRPPRNPEALNETGKRLKELRIRFGLSRRQIGQLLNVCESTLVRIETWPGHNTHAHIDVLIKRLVDVLETASREIDSTHGVERAAKILRTAKEGMEK